MNKDLKPMLWSACFQICLFLKSTFFPLSLASSPLESNIWTHIQERVPSWPHPVSFAQTSAPVSSLPLWVLFPFWTPLLVCQVFQLLSQSPAPQLSLCVLSFAPHSCSRPLKNSFALHFSPRPLKSNICPNLDLNPIGFPGGWDGKEPACNAGDPGSVSRSGRSLEKGMATHSSILAWRIQQTEEPGGLQSTGLQRVGHD